MQRGIPLKQARNHFDSRPSRATIHRWRRKGILNRFGDRVRLETYYEGGCVYVSIEAIKNFKLQLNRCV